MLFNLRWDYLYSSRNLKSFEKRVAFLSHTLYVCLDLQSFNSRILMKVPKTNFKRENKLLKNITGEKWIWKTRKNPLKILWDYAMFAWKITIHIDYIRISRIIIMCVLWASSLFSKENAPPIWNAFKIEIFPFFSLILCTTITL